MYRGIIGDAISVDRKDDSVFGQFKRGGYRNTDRNWFKDKKGRVHNFYHAGSSTIELVNYQGLLSDSWKHQDIQSIFNKNVRSTNSVLDLDLDFFTYTDDEGYS